MWKLHKRNIVVSIVGLVGILGFIFLGILPNSGEAARQEAEIQRLKGEIDREKVLLPIYLDLKKESDAYGPCELPNPQAIPLGRDEADGITGLLETGARKSRMKLIGAVPDINSLTETGRYLSVAVKLTGQFAEFRNFLTQLGGVACVRHVEKIHIKAVPRYKEFDLTVWFAVGTGEAEDGKKQAETPS